MEKVNDYIESDEERDEGHVNTREKKILNAKTKTPILDVIPESMLQDKNR